MKKLILLCFIMIFFSCNNKSSEKLSESEKKKSEIEKDYEFADMLLMFEGEKIGLLSIIKDVPSEKIHAVLRDYKAKTMSNSSYYSLEDPNYLVNLIDTIATKNNLSKKLTASIIFSYKYEMITEDEIVENYREYYEEY
ncbi:MAG: hypothetical protein GW823_03290 [Bacteroidetes bacterium]|nr:hypothetical protein [Bacteroidota bacterium]